MIPAIWQSHCKNQLTLHLRHARSTGRQVNQLHMATGWTGVSPWFVWQIPTKKDQGSRDNWRFQYWILNLSTMAEFWHEICVWYRFWGEEYEVEKYIGQTGGKGANSKIPNSCAFFSIWGFVNTYTIITFTTRGRQYHAREISTLILKSYFSTCKPSFQKRLVQHSSVVLDLSYLMGVLFNRRPDYQTTSNNVFELDRPMMMRTLLYILGRHMNSHSVLSGNIACTVYCNVW